MNILEKAVAIGIISKEKIPLYSQLANKQGFDIEQYIVKVVLSSDEVDFLQECCEFQVNTKQTLGNFFVQQKIGEGGMGVIYKAYDLKARRVVALKIIKKTGISVLRFQREMQLLAQINHPNIVTFYGVHQINDMILYSMEFVKGKTLSQHKQLSIYKIAKIMSQATSAIHFIHQMGIIHRDIKPSNIMITEDFTPKIMDFGLAREENVSSEITKTGVFIGTIHYASPEQIKGEKLDSSTDVYSLGATLYKLLTNTVPFDAKSIHGIAKKINEQPPINPPNKLMAISN